MLVCLGIPLLCICVYAFGGGAAGVFVVAVIFGATFCAVGLSASDFRQGPLTETERLFLVRRPPLWNLFFVGRAADVKTAPIKNGDGRPALDRPRETAAHLRRIGVQHLLADGDAAYPWLRNSFACYLEIRGISVGICKETKDVEFTAEAKEQLEAGIVCALAQLPWYADCYPYNRHGSSGWEGCTKRQMSKCDVSVGHRDLNGGDLVWPCDIKTSSVDPARALGLWRVQSLFRHLSARCTGRAAPFLQPAAKWPC